MSTPRPSVDLSRGAVVASVGETSSEPARSRISQGTARCLRAGSSPARQRRSVAHGARRVTDLVRLARSCDDDSGAPLVLPKQLDLRRMVAINTEDAARRLARVILSDIDLYQRERPKLGGSREAQIEEGRRLFASRVIPELVPVFAMVLADRAAGRLNAPAPPTSAPAATVGPVHSPPAPSAAIEDEPKTDPSIWLPPLEDRSSPAPAPAARSVVNPPPPRAPAALKPATEDRPTPAPPIAARSLAARRPPAPPPAARPVPHAPPPPPVVARAGPEIPIRVPPASPAAGSPAAVAQAGPVAPPAPEVPAHVPTAPAPAARASIPRLLTIVSVAAAILVAVLHRLFR
jgi:hypothetical protein